MELSVESSNSIKFLVNSKYRIYRHLVLQIIILLITIGIFFDTPDSLNLSLNRFYGWVTYFLFMNMQVYVNVYVLFPCFWAKNKIKQYISAVVIFALFSLFILMILQGLFYDIAITNHKFSFIAISLSISSSFLAILLFIGGISTFMIFKNLIKSNMIQQELRTATKESELKFLKSQINPHFLFNTINNANILVDDEPKVASSILNKLDDLLRYQLEDSQKQLVKLKDDIHFLTDYLDLEKIRRDLFEYKVEIKGCIDHILIAPLLFIPFVENAIKHNSDTKAISYVYLFLALKNKELTFICENSKPLSQSKHKDGGLGLVNIHRRLNLLYEDNYNLEKHETEQMYSIKLVIKI